ncbi:MAG: rhodanese-like domain-containing protein [Mogibacterium sp.]|nr:rhodanese-like domain-containing protein [Mogibacterium sp.]
MKRKELLSVITLIMASAFLLGACIGLSYKRISQNKAMKIMEEETGYLIVDVRRPDEFAEGHIEGAINVPNEEIADEMPEKLPDKDQLLLVYCRTGRRSKEAAEKLAKIGYTNIYEIGGINTWPGTIVTED